MPQTTFKEKDLHDYQRDFMLMTEHKMFTLQYVFDNLHTHEVKNVISLWTALIDEEARQETVDVIRKRLLSELPKLKNSREQKEYDLETLALVIDGCVDSLYVVMGLMNAIGVDIERYFMEVHEANMAKGTPCDCNGYLSGCPKCKGSGRIVTRRADGKVMKPVGWKAPDIKLMIARELQGS